MIGRTGLRKTISPDNFKNLNSEEIYYHHYAKKEGEEIFRRVFFDLKVGDRVSYLSGNVDETKYYTITKIYPGIFACVDKKGRLATFSKAQYICGEIRKVKAYPND